MLAPDLRMSCGEHALTASVGVKIFFIESKALGSHGDLLLCLCAMPSAAQFAHEAGRNSQLQTVGCVLT